VAVKLNPSFPQVTFCIVLKAKNRAWHASLRNGGRETRNTNDVAPTLSDTRGAQVVHLIVVEEDGPVPICVTDDRGVGVGVSRYIGQVYSGGTGGVSYLSWCDSLLLLANHPQLESRPNLHPFHGASEQCCSPHYPHNLPAFAPQRKGLSSWV